MSSTGNAEGARPTATVALVWNEYREWARFARGLKQKHRTSETPCGVRSPGRILSPVLPRHQLPMIGTWQSALEKRSILELGGFRSSAAKAIIGQCGPKVPIPPPGLAPSKTCGGHASCTTNDANRSVAAWIGCAGFSTRPARLSR